MLEAQVPEYIPSKLNNAQIEIAKQILGKYFSSIKYIQEMVGDDREANICGHSVTVYDISKLNSFSPLLSALGHGELSRAILLVQGVGRVMDKCSNVFAALSCMYFEYLTHDTDYPRDHWAVNMGRLGFPDGWDADKVRDTIFRFVAEEFKAVREAE